MTHIEITDCRVRPCIQADDKLRAFATITLNNAFVVCDLKVIDGNDGIFVAMPSRRRKDGTFRDIAHPLNAETREYVEKVVLREYILELERRGEEMPSLPAHLKLEDILPRQIPPGARPRRPAEAAVLSDLARGSNGRGAARSSSDEVEDELGSGAGASAPSRSSARGRAGEDFEQDLVD